jgi:hypothetical protein
MDIMRSFIVGAAAPEMGIHPRTLRPPNDEGLSDARL